MIDLRNVSRAELKFLSVEESYIDEDGNTFTVEEVTKDNEGNIIGINALSIPH
jgi:hypothetical protein